MSFWFGMRIVTAQILCRLSSIILRALGHGGTSLPGRIALHICPDLLSILGRGVTVTLITGTNGKTTTARIIEESFIIAGLRCFSNRSGANLLPGITAVFSAHSSLTGRSRFSYAVIECDEAAFRSVSQYLEIDIVVVTNIFRDQLDRYGEITHTADIINMGLKNCSKAVLCLNADCSLTVSLAEGLSNRIVYFGVDCSFDEDSAFGLSDAAYCIKCQGKYNYVYTTFGHLGGFSCQECGYARPMADATVTKIYQMDADSSEIELRVFEETFSSRVNLPGSYNIYNASAAAAAAAVKGFPGDVIVGALNSFRCSFGRSEKFWMGGSEVRIMLVKNPVGFNQVLSFITKTDFEMTLILALNDRLADGTDVSWIWDVDFEMLLRIKQRILRFYVTGIRAGDMALRLKYAGFSESDINLISDYGELIAAAAKDGRHIFILPTYSALLDIRHALSKFLPVKAFYE